MTTKYKDPRVGLWIFGLCGLRGLWKSLGSLGVFEGLWGSLGSWVSFGSLDLTPECKDPKLDLRICLFFDDFAVFGVFGFFAGSLGVFEGVRGLCVVWSLWSLWDLLILLGL